MNKKIIEGFLQLRKNCSIVENTRKEPEETEGRLLSS
jgi:hypothetical protein